MCFCQSDCAFFSPPSSTSHALTLTTLLPTSLIRHSHTHIRWTPFLLPTLNGWLQFKASQKQQCKKTSSFESQGKPSENSKHRKSTAEIIRTCQHSRTRIFALEYINLNPQSEETVKTSEWSVPSCIWVHLCISNLRSMLCVPVRDAPTHLICCLSAKQWFLIGKAKVTTGMRQTNKPSQSPNFLLCPGKSAHFPWSPSLFLSLLLQHFLGCCLCSNQVILETTAPLVPPPLPQ